MSQDEEARGEFSAQERSAMRRRAAELRADARRSRAADRAAAEEADVLATIAAMDDGDRALAERVHALVADVAADLAPKLYYGQPGYARDGKVVVFFRSGRGDKLRYSTLGVSAHAPLDDAGGLWPTSYALTDPDPDAWARVRSIIGRAARTGEADPGTR